MASTAPVTSADDPVDAGEVSQLEYADLLFRHIGSLVGPRIPLATLRVADFCATVDLTEPIELPADTILQPDPTGGDSGRQFQLPRTREVIRGLLDTSDQAFPDVVPLVGGSLGTVVISDARAVRSTPLSASLTRRAVRGHALAPWRFQLVSVSAIDGLDTQWQLDELLAWLHGERSELWDDASDAESCRGAIVFSPLDEQAGERWSAVGQVPADIPGIGTATVVQCRVDANHAPQRRPQGIREVQPISVDDHNWVFVLGS
jgi:hypothetical protein